jgi:putative SOS response-associated peptidase YedK
MCVNYLPASRRQLREYFGVTPPDADWPDECWQDYPAPIITAGATGSLQALTANYGFVPKRHQPPGIRLSTLNARAETVGLRRSYRDAWHNGQRCLVPMLAFFEPCYERGRAVRHRIGLTNGLPFAVAGIWRSWAEPDGSTSHAFSQLTINADDHPLLQRMHRPGEEKRSLVIVPPAHYSSWLHSPHPAHAMLLPYPADRMYDQAAPYKKDAPPGPVTLDLF